MSPEQRMKVVVNDEAQYSVWPAGDRPPAGWHETPVEGTREECLSWIDENWTDMRPRSVRLRDEAL